MKRLMDVNEARDTQRSHRVEIYSLCLRFWKINFAISPPAAVPLQPPRRRPARSALDTYFFQRAAPPKLPKLENIKLAFHFGSFDSARRARPRPRASPGAAPKHVTGLYFLNDFYMAVSKVRPPSTGPGKRRRCDFAMSQTGCLTASFNKHIDISYFAKDYLHIYKPII
ncbi:hypothetical protein EVAR_87928_1 [Eumeta japonica]|uniref:Uncharacterized protein n=1 Tax=Eumeta variegata TaxID=151549 RepID=A0A4C1WVC4_EUMVA|nr:hypothetical protein EVAR_87928_1 [Eumeta japonica]